MRRSAAHESAEVPTGALHGGVVMSRVSRFVAFAAIALALVLAGTAVGATLQKNGGPVTAVRTATADDNAHSTATTWTDVPGMSVAVNVPAGERALLIVTFSAVNQC